MNILYCIIASLLLCIFYVGGIEILEKYMPIAKWDIGMEITFLYSIILLLLTMLLQMIIKLYIEKRKYIALLPFSFRCYIGYHIMIYFHIVPFSYCTKLDGLHDLLYSFKNNNT